MSKLITLEGLDGAGKSALVQPIMAAIQQHGPAIHAREPGGVHLAEQIRALLLKEDMAVLTETLLFFAARAELLDRLVVPVLKQDVHVLLDRYIDSTWAYQVAAKGLDPHVFDLLTQCVCKEAPISLTLWVDTPPAVAEGRRTRRWADADRFEREADSFHEKVYAGYLDRALAEPNRIVRLDGSLPQSDLIAAAEAAIHALFSTQKVPSGAA